MPGVANRTSILTVFLISLAFATPGLADPSDTQKCEASIYKIIGKHVSCTSRAAAAFAKDENTYKYDRRLASCERNYEWRYSRALDKWSDACPTLDDSPHAAKERVETSVSDFSEEVVGLLSSTPPNPVPGMAIVYNNCTLPVKLMSPTNSVINGVVLNHLEKESLDLKKKFHKGQANTILAAPVTSAAQCTALNCSTWTDILYAPAPPNGATNTTQRTGSMYDGSNAAFGAYCQPTNAAANQCTTNSGTPCCGTNMNFDKSFGTLWEITPFGGTDGDTDTIDLSTNYGSGPNTPPDLCPTGGPDNCVIASANIFYNVPIEIEMSGEACSCGSLGSKESITCTDISCTDAFQYPTDDKNCSCSSGGQRGYLITYCPDGSSLPALPSIP